MYGIFVSKIRAFIVQATKAILKSPVDCYMSKCLSLCHQPVIIFLSHKIFHLNMHFITFIQLTILPCLFSFISKLIYHCL